MSKPHPKDKLTPVSVRHKGLGRHADGRGLYLLVDGPGSRRWVLRVMVRGRRRDIGLGSAHDVSLADAREKARRLRKIAKDGGDPLAERRQKASPEFETAARKCFEERADAWRNERHRAQWIASLEAYAFPIIGRTPVDQIGTPEVLKVLTPIWLSKAETARRVRQRIGLVLDWAMAQDYRPTRSPTHEIGRVLPQQKGDTKHHAALPYADVPGFLKKFRATGAADVSKDAMEFLILTACRTSEVLGARWSEMNLSAATWTIPGDRMKSGRLHTVPLQSRAVEILKARKAAHSGKGDLVFEAKPDQSLSNMTLLVGMRRLELDAVPHGFRSSFRDWAAERTTAPREVAEACLAHVVPDKVERAYKRTEFLERRRKLMDAWAAHCGGGAKVLRFPRKASR